MEPATLNRQPEQLSQQEIEQLLAQVATEESQAVIHRGNGTKDRQPRQQFQPHDFRAPGFLAAGQWRRLRREQQDYVNSLAGRLSNHLRLEVVLRLAQLETRACRAVLEGLAEPTHLALFKLEPLRGICLLEIPPQLGLTIVDRLMGGPGQSAMLNRDLSEIEVALLDQALLIMLEEWCRHWAGVQDLRPAILGHETSGRYLQIAPADVMMLVLVVEARMGDCLEQIKLAFPCTTLEPLLRQLKPAVQPGAGEQAPAPAAKPTWKPGLNQVPVELAALWPARQLSARQITQLKAGDVLEWDPVAAGQVRLCVGQNAKFTGRLGTRQNRWAVEITGLLRGPSA